MTTKSKPTLPSTPVGRRRLLKLANLLEVNARNKKGARFDITNWGRVDRGVQPGMSCGTTVCAVGLAAVSGAFRRAGLRYGINERFGEIKVSHVDAAAIKQLAQQLKARHAPEFLAAMYLFGLSEKEATFFFVPHNQGGCKLPNEGRGAAAERALAGLIRDFVAGKVSP